MNGKVVAFVAVMTFVMGYSVADTRGDLAMMEYKAEQSAAFEAQQEKVRKDYEERLAALASELERVRIDNAERMRQLEKFKRTQRDVQTCHEQRNRLASIACGLEEVADRAVSRLESMTRK